MEQKAWELALSWERVRDVEVEVKSATLAYVKARIGYTGPNGVGRPGFEPRRTK